MEPNASQKILIVQTAFLGDVLLGIPLLKTLRKPGARLSLLCRRGVGSYFLDSGLVDEVIEVQKSSRDSWRVAREKLRDREFDLIVCPHESLRTALFVRTLRARRKIGYSRWFNRFIFDDRIKRPLDLPESLRQLELLSSLEPRLGVMNAQFRAAQSASGGQSNLLEGGLLPVPIGADMKVPALIALRNARHVGRHAAEATSDLSVQISSVIEPFFDLRERLVVLAPGSVWATKKWTKEGFIESGRKLAGSAVVVVMGSKDESRLCTEIAQAIPNSTSLAGRTTLWESAQLLACADLLVCNDSGAMHLGASAGVPIVSVFGPTVLEFGYRPWASNARVVETELNCRPCGKHGSDRCPIGTHDCMKKVSATQVLTAAQSLSGYSAE